MKYHSAFEIIGPAMVGPSSSHTAGAVRIGNVARQILGEVPVHADFMLTGSFAETYRGHGTDVALLAGILGLTTADERVPDAPQLASDVGLSYQFRTGSLGFYHPNTVSVSLRGATSATSLIASSFGGGKIEVQELEGLPVRLSGERPTLVLYHRDNKGFLAAVSQTLHSNGYNIVRLNLERQSRGGEAITAVEVDDDVDSALPSQLKANIPGLREVRTVHTL
ncbi:L-serine ammonia-lyase, iron-sulfur-dependent subunit beta [Alicyclobacillus sp. ALC3]|uniref:L-serine ammonia-lyase, iron-sulfur-dependent subunit beta n=1 Tax=Alicyclobacillus sp. ALC3 TaxID=2796143 RepID=UPI002377FF77|nr:L-serine ammonia-lyase, iron-sulfur-dependent subunit beta [Alicyclobacillus sp. ALC3]WDL97527.1 L-serine ammonia-lyase, iron-sulfur-dependent subunit beta [Alicyclobacillus sp. ALC3]